ncbi:MAG: DUF4229 domain-containing protein [Actinomycetota bacterium]
MIAFWRYTLSRAGLFALTFGLLYLVAGRRVDVLLVALLALLVSGLLSYVLLRGQRDALAAQVAERARRAQQRMDAATRAEDDADERRRRESGEG